MSTTYLKFDKNSKEMQTFITWWNTLNDNRGDRAELRRCARLAEVVFTPAYHRLRLSVGKFGVPHTDGLALMAGLAARVKNDTADCTFAEQMATGKSDGSAKVSGMRFRRLLKANESDELFAALGRIVALLGGSVNLQNLTKSVYFWNDRTRKQWAFEYYSKTPSEQ